MAQTTLISRVQATELGLQKLKEAKDDQRTEDGQKMTYERIAEKSYVSVSRVKGFFRGERVYRDNAIAIVKVLNLDLAEVIGKELSDSEIEEPFIIHRHTFQQMLDKQYSLTTNPFTTANGTTFNHKDIYVPLGMVERKEQPKRNQYEGFPEKGSELYQEKVTPIEHEQFFEEVLGKGESPKSQGKRIAIIGEPGAGKTTQLQKIANWLFTKTEDVVVWVSLADLQERSLEDHLFQVWLKDAFNMKTGGVTTAMENALVERFNEGKAWLLLDGVDEMGANNPLYDIASQLKGWIASARVLLTCRLNVWDSGKNYLTEFDIYRNLDFSEIQQKVFISKYFAETPEVGETLKAELDKPGKERLKDLVKNPLRLTLLCSSWQRREGKLPETKAGLYEWFVKTFYEWKEEYFSTTSAQRKELNAALGELAKTAIDQPSSRFRLTRTQVSQFLGEPDEQVFKLAIDLGWLNCVGMAEENPDEPVYAFFHPTFQEYFAALAIDDWHFFLNHVPENPEEGHYRIFESQWKEVYLLWLGQEQIEREQKENLIYSLAEFDDTFCQSRFGFYSLRAYNLAVIGISQYKDYSQAYALVQKMVHDYFGYFDCEKQQWIYYEILLSDYSYLRSALSQTDPIILDSLLSQKIISYTQHLTNYLKNNPNETVSFCDFSGICEESSFAFPRTLKTLVNLLDNDNQKIVIEIAKLINAIQPKHPKVIEAVTNLIDTDSSKLYLEVASYWLKIKIDLEGFLGVSPQLLSDDIEDLDQNTLESLSTGLIKHFIIFRHNDNNFVLEKAVEIGRKLAKLCPENSEVFQVYAKLNEILENLSRSKKYQENVSDCSMPDDHPDHHFMILEKTWIYLNNHLQKKQQLVISFDRELFFFLSEYLDEDTLKGLISSDQRKWLQKIFSELKEDLPSHIKVQFHRRPILIRNRGLDVLQEFTRKMTYPNFYKAWNNLLDSTHPESKDYSPIGKSSTTKTLDSQVADIATQLQPTPQAYPIVIDLETLAGETDLSAIASEFCYQIHTKVFPNNPNIPTVNNAYSLKPLIHSIKHHLEIQNIVLILQNGQPYEELIAFCHKLTNALHIAWITDQPIEPPLRGFPPQPNLVSVLQNWLHEIASE